MQFQNPFLAEFSPSVPEPLVQRNRKSVASGDTLVFQHDYENHFASVDAYDVIRPSKAYKNDFNRELESGDSVNALDQQLYRNSTAFTPLTLKLSRKGLTQSTQICDPVNGDVIYSIKETCRGMVSRDPDLEITRTLSGDVPVGTISYNLFSNEIKSSSTNQSYKGIENFRSCQLREQEPGSVLRWRVKQRKTRLRRQLKSDGSIHTTITEPLVKLELINPSHMDEKPLCIVSMYTTRPLGLIDVYAKSACVNYEGGDWLALDEVILSAYANMDLARQKLMRGSRADANGSMATNLFDPFNMLIR